MQLELGDGLYPELVEGYYPELVEGHYPELVEGYYPEPVEGHYPELVEGLYPELVEGLYPELVEGLNLISCNPSQPPKIAPTYIGSPIKAASRPNIHVSLRVSSRASRRRK